MYGLDGVLARSERMTRILRLLRAPPLAPRVVRRAWTRHSRPSKLFKNKERLSALLLLCFACLSSNWVSNRLPVASLHFLQRQRKHSIRTIMHIEGTSLKYIGLNTFFRRVPRKKNPWFAVSPNPEPSLHLCNELLWNYSQDNTKNKIFKTYSIHYRPTLRGPIQLGYGSSCIISYRAN